VTPEPVIRALTIERFRGFLERRTILLDATATIVAGPNGSGKTSLFDAVQWLMLGRIERLASLATRRSGEYVVSSFARSGELAVVSADLRIDGRHVVVRREGTAKSNVLTWHDVPEMLTGTDAEAKLCKTLLGDSELTLSDTVLTSGLLQQDVVRAVLENQPKDRYRHMASMLGLTDIAGFEDQARAASEGARKDSESAHKRHNDTEARLVAARAQLERLEKRLVAEPALKHARASLQARLSEVDLPLTVASLPEAAPDAVTLGQWARRLTNRAAELERELTDLESRAAQSLATDDAQVEETKRAVDRLRAQLESHRIALTEAETAQTRAQERASQLAELAAAALPLLSERCPVCRQEIDATGVAEHLHELTTTDGKDLAVVRERSRVASQEMDRTLAELGAATAKQREIEAARRHAEALASARDTWLRECHSLSEDAGPDLDREVGDAIRAGDRIALERLREAAQAIAGVADELAALLGSSALSEEVARQREVGVHGASSR